MDIPAEVMRIVKNHFEKSDDVFKPEATFTGDLEADSLALVELVLEFEEVFDIDIPDEDVQKIATIQDAITYIESHVKKS